MTRDTASTTQCTHAVDEATRVRLLEHRGQPEIGDLHHTTARIKYDDNASRAYLALVCLVDEHVARVQIAVQHGRRARVQPREAARRRHCEHDQMRAADRHC
jgi:hypothetical protein